jgi:hypothetical protein
MRPMTDYDTALLKTYDIGLQRVWRFIGEWSKRGGPKYMTFRHLEECCNAELSPTYEFPSWERLIELRAIVRAWAAAVRATPPQHDMSLDDEIIQTCMYIKERLL